MTHADAQKISQWIDDHFDDEVAFLAALIKVPSDNPPGACAAHAARTADLLDAMGLTVEHFEVPSETVRENGMIDATNLVVRHRFGPGPVVALNAHGDVVAPGDGWSVDPYGAVIRDGEMFGRGVAVSKSDFATYAFALRALRDTGTLQVGTIELHLTYDEEAGGAIGPKWLLEEGHSKPDFAVCAGFSYGIVTHHNGCLHLEITLTGKSAHAARPDTGHDALRAATSVLEALYRYREKLGDLHSAVEGIDTPSLVVGLIEGGINTNVVPDKVSFRLDRRLIPEESPETAEKEIRDLVEGLVGTMEGIRADIRQIMLARPFLPVSTADHVTGIFANHASTVFGETITGHGVPLYTDARHYSEAGVPTIIYGAGPRTLLEANAHRADEKLRLGDLKNATKVVALALRELLSEG